MSRKIFYGVLSTLFYTTVSFTAYPLSYYSAFGRRFHAHVLSSKDELLHFITTRCSSIVVSKRKWSHGYIKCSIVSYEDENRLESLPNRIISKTTDIFVRDEVVSSIVKKPSVLFHFFYPVH